MLPPFRSKQPVGDEIMQSTSNIRLELPTEKYQASQLEQELACTENRQAKGVIPLFRLCRVQICLNLYVINGSIALLLWWMSYPIGHFARRNPIPAALGSFPFPGAFQNLGGFVETLQDHNGGPVLSLTAWDQSSISPLVWWFSFDAFYLVRKVSG